ncbi:hypothetical protein [Neobacillus terrae]|uniref:hypothetical protein n=1 Tax=Neobacillus terrae TaxID=3034837 RepID=UPI001FB0B491|nr:hypothetical protein [Neobacillus terrae]
MSFLILMVILFNLVVIIFTKRISGIEILTTILFAEALQVMTDIFLDLKYALYGYYHKSVDKGGLIYIFGIFPAVNIGFLNFFPNKKPLINKVI